MQCLRAAWALPLSGPPIPDAEVVIEGDRILEVRPAASASGSDVRDFGEAVLLPGLVNVHTHLDYTVMRGLLEDIEFFPWIRELTARKAALTWEDWVASATWGAAEAAAGGVTTIGDCTDSGAALFGAKALGLGGIIYQEVFGIDEQRPVGEIVQELAGKVVNLRAESAGTRLAVGVSPHAPYTVRPALFRALTAYAEQEALPLCIHAAESRAEAELLRSGTGLIAEMFTRRGIDWQPPGGSTVAYLDSLGILGPRTLLVHGVQVSASDRAILQAREVAWAHCPKSNAKLGVGVAPLGILGRARRQGEPEPPASWPRLGLGSDSVASNNTMDLFEEMRFAVLLQRGARHRLEAFSAQEALEMATRGGARALRQDAEIGTLEPGKRADLCVVRLGELHSAPAYDPVSALVYTARASDVVYTLAAGETLYDAARGPRLADRFPQINLTPVREQLGAAARKMREWRPTNS
jgi:5-methylthioadenosine/S-adenosylhomocysteine deaminase